MVIMSQICDKLKELVTIPFKSKEEEKSEGSVVQKQTAGEGATQIQANNINYFVGIDETKAKEISMEVFNNQRQMVTAEAFEVAKKRVEMLESKLIPRIAEIEGALNEFAKPEFQFALGSAQRTAASSEREIDLELLTELLACRIEKGNQRKVNVGLRCAVEVVNEIDDDALCALTVAHAVTAWMPAHGDCLQGLDILNDLFGKLMYQNLPDNNDWLEHLELLNLIRISNYFQLVKLEEYYEQHLDGYVCAGIKIDSAEFNEATRVLIEANLPVDLLKHNKLIDGYVRLAVPQKEELKSSRLLWLKDLTENQRDALHRVYELYSKDVKAKQIVHDNFIKAFDERENLKKLRTWRNKISTAFQIKKSGVVIAYSNAKRCDKTLPDLI